LQNLATLLYEFTNVNNLLNGIHLSFNLIRVAKGFLGFGVHFTHPHHKHR
jgi:hypothetical protein